MRTGSVVLEKELTAEEFYSKGLSAYNACNYSDAVKWLRQAADRGHAGAQYYLGACYEFGIGTQIDRPLAYAMYRRAAELGFVDERSCRKAIFLKLVK